MNYGEMVKYKVGKCGRALSLFPVFFSIFFSLFLF